MTHPLLCPSCEFTTRVSDELFARKVSGRRVKIPCKGCGASLLVDATAAIPRVTRHQSSRPPRATHDVPGQRSSEAPRRSAGAAVDGSVPMPPLARARALQEEELPTLRRNEVPTDEAFLPPVATSEAPVTSWLRAVPPLGGTDQGPFMVPARRRGSRIVVVALLAVCSGAAASWGAAIWASRGEASNRGAGASEGVRGSEAEASPSSSARQGGVRVTAVGSGASQRPDELEGPPEAESGTVAGLVAEVGAAAEAAPPSSAPTRASASSAIARAAERGAPDVSSGSLASSEGAVEEQGSATAEPERSETANEPEVDSMEVELQPFDKDAAAASLQAAEGQAGACRGAGDPSGTARVVVTFAPSGRVTSATVSGAPFAGTPTGGCIASRFRSARVPPFSGSYVTVAKTVVVR